MFNDFWKSVAVPLRELSLGSWQLCCGPSSLFHCGGFLQHRLLTVTMDHIACRGVLHGCVDTQSKLGVWGGRVWALGLVWAP